MAVPIKETLMRRITVTSSLNEISTDQLAPHPLSIAGFWTDI
jgi:hypothetical protein